MVKKSKRSVCDELVKRHQLAEKKNRCPWSYPDYIGNPEGERIYHCYLWDPIAKEGAGWNSSHQIGGRRYCTLEEYGSCPLNPT